MLAEAALRFRVAIPARYASTRLPGKPLRMLAGRTPLEHVYRQALASGAEQVVIATDDPRIAAAAAGFGALVCMTATTHLSGTDRLAEVAERYGWSDETVVVNACRAMNRNANGAVAVGGGGSDHASRGRHGHGLRADRTSRRGV